MRKFPVCPPNRYKHSFKGELQDTGDGTGFNKSFEPNLETSFVRKANQRKKSFQILGIDSVWRMTFERISFSSRRDLEGLSQRYIDRTDVY